MCALHLNVSSCVDSRVCSSILICTGVLSLYIRMCAVYEGYTLELWCRWINIYTVGAVVIPPVCRYIEPLPHPRPIDSFHPRWRTFFSFLFSLSNIFLLFLCFFNERGNFISSLEGVLASVLLRLAYRDVYMTTRTLHRSPVLPVIIRSGIVFRDREQGRTERFFLHILINQRGAPRSK